MPVKSLTFTADVKRFAANARKQTEGRKRAIAIKLFNAIIQGTPVDTGRLRAAWTTTLERPDFTEYERSQAETNAMVTQVANQAMGDVSIVLTNPLPYAERIEYGHSQQQAPAGMVRINVERFKKLLGERLT